MKRMFHSATDKFISKSNVHFGPRGKYKENMLKKERVLSLPPACHTLGIRVLWPVLWHMSIIAQPTWLQGWGFVICNHKVQSFLGFSCFKCYWDKWTRTMQRKDICYILSSGQDGSTARAGRERSWCWGVPWKALLDLGWEVWPSLSCWYCLWTDHCSLQGSKEKTVSSASLSVALSQYCLTKGSAPARRSHSSKMPHPSCLKCLLWCPVTHGSFWLTGFCSLQVSGWEGDVFHRAYNRTLALTSTTRRLTPFQNDMVRGF